MNSFQQGALDSLCGIYSLVNAERKINNSSLEESQGLFKDIITYLDEQKILASTLINGMLLKDIKSALINVIGERIPYKRIHFVGVANPDLNTFWDEVATFLEESSIRTVLLGIAGVYDHWTVVQKVSEKQINLLDVLNNICTFLAHLYYQYIHLESFRLISRCIPIVLFRG